MANQLTLIAESAPRGQVASLLALSALGGSLGGILSTLATGRLIDAYGYVPVFTVLSALHPLAFGVLVVAERTAMRRPQGGS
jgi:ACS family hexuronate transporter-like MFS transporter